MTGMNFRQALGSVVRERRQADGLQLRELANSAHISYSFLSEVERGLKEASSVVIDGIANGLSIEPYELILEAGYRMATGDLEAVSNPRQLDWLNQYQDLIATS
jgi:transcriptional regulator with XRE-family HTH domain